MSTLHTDTTNAPRIPDGKHFDNQQLHYPLLARSWSRLVTTESYRFVWLSQAAADSIAAAKDTTPGTNASTNRTNDIGAFQVAISETVEGAWSEDT